MSSIIECSHPYWVQHNKDMTTYQCSDMLKCKVTFSGRTLCPKCSNGTILFIQIAMNEFNGQCNECFYRIKESGKSILKIQSKQFKHLNLN